MLISSLVNLLSASTISLHCCHVLLASKNNNNNNNSIRDEFHYNYFAYGSNMALSTMTNLRRITPLAATAAMLPHYELRFNVPGIPGVEPSAASVEPIREGSKGATEAVVHGVLYKLTQADFATICLSEGVPFLYSLQRCTVVPYTGDGRKAGVDHLKHFFTMTEVLDSKHSFKVAAFTLRVTFQPWRHPSVYLPPSQSYLNVLIRGAEEFQLDQEYVERLNGQYLVSGVIIGEGLAEMWLGMAETKTSAP